jgi:hypothetical protein
MIEMFQNIEWNPAWTGYIVAGCFVIFFFIYNIYKNHKAKKDAEEWKKVEEQRRRELQAQKELTAFSIEKDFNDIDLLSTSAYDKLKKQRDFIFCQIEEHIDKYKQAKEQYQHLAEYGAKLLAHTKLLQSQLVIYDEHIKKLEEQQQKVVT